MTSGSGNQGDESTSDDETNLEEEAHRATIAGISISRRAAVWTMISALIAAVGVLVAMLVPALQSSAGITVTGDGNQVVQGGGSIHNYSRRLDEFEGSLPPNPGETEIRDAARKFADVNPSGVGPWPFVVIADPRLGAKVRSSGTTDGVQVGSAAFNTAVWANCRLHTSFNPTPGDPNGAVWYRIRWPNTRPTTEFFGSSPGDQSEQWIYGGLVVPIGHNGMIPTCH